MLHDDTVMKLTPISYAALGILAERECSTYELVKAVSARFGTVLGGSERRYFDEPKRLEAHGLIAGAEEWVGERPRIIWSITVDGRVELARWVGQPDLDVASGSYPDLARVLLAQHASKQQLVAVLDKIAGDAQEWGLRMAMTSGGDAHPLDDLVAAYLLGLAKYTRDWADDAARTVLGWRSTSAPGIAQRKGARKQRDARARDLERTRPPST